MPEQLEAGDSIDLLAEGFWCCCQKSRPKCLGCWARTPLCNRERVTPHTGRGTPEVLNYAGAQGRWSTPWVTEPPLSSDLINSQSSVASFFGLFRLAKTIFFLTNGVSCLGSPHFLSHGACQRDRGYELGKELSNHNPGCWCWCWRSVIHVALRIPGQPDLRRSALVSASTLPALGLFCSCCVRRQR